MATISGGDKLAKRLAEISKKLAKPTTLRVGFLEGATYPDDAGTSVAQVAWWFNFGHKGTPPRPFFTDMVEAKSGGWGDSLARILESNGGDIDNALNKMGIGIGEQLQKALIDCDSPALSPVTLMLRQMLIDDPHLTITGKTVGEAAARVAAGDDYSKASTKPGVYTGHMLKSVGYQIDGEDSVTLPPPKGY